MTQLSLISRPFAHAYCIYNQPDSEIASYLDYEAPFSVEMKNAGGAMIWLLALLSVSAAFALAAFRCSAR